MEKDESASESDEPEVAIDGMEEEPVADPYERGQQAMEAGLVFR